MFFHVRDICVTHFDLQLKEADRGRVKVEGPIGVVGRGFWNDRSLDVILGAVGLSEDSSCLGDLGLVVKLEDEFANVSFGASLLEYKVSSHRILIRFRTLTTRSAQDGGA